MDARPNRLTVNMGDVPEPVRAGEESFEAFHAALALLFEAHPTTDADMKFQRGNAFRILKGADGSLRTSHDARRAAFWAMDSGIPNDVIFAVYGQLFL